MDKMNHTLNHNAAPFTPQKFRINIGAGQDLVDGSSSTAPLSSAPRLGESTSDISPPSMRASSGNMTLGRSVIDWDFPTNLGSLSPLDIQIGNSVNDIAACTTSSGSTDAMLSPDTCGLGIDSLDSLGLHQQLQLLSLNSPLGFNAMIGSGVSSSRLSNNNNHTIVNNNSNNNNCTTNNNSSNNRRNGISNSSSATPNNENSPTNLIINYLPQSLTRADMHLRFEAIGALRSCKLVYGQTPHTGGASDTENSLVSMCYGFVDYVNPLDAIQAIATYHQAQWEKKRLRVAFASRWHVVVLNVPKWCTQDFIRKAFQIIGTVQRCLVQRDEDTLSRNFNAGLAYLDFEDRAGSKQVFDAKTVSGPDGVHFFKINPGVENAASVVFKCRWVLFDEPPKAGNNHRLPSVSDMGAAGLSSLMQRPRSDSNRFSHWNGPPSEDSLNLMNAASLMNGSTWDHENVSSLLSNGSSSSAMRSKDVLDIDDYMRDNPGIRMADLISSRIGARLCQGMGPTNKARPIVKNRDAGLKLGNLDSGLGTNVSLASILREVNSNVNSGLTSDRVSSVYTNNYSLAGSVAPTSQSIAFPIEPIPADLRREVLFNSCLDELTLGISGDSSPVENAMSTNTRLRIDPEEMLHVETPLMARPEMSEHVGAGAQVYLKLDNLQPTRSFKQRGIGLFCSRAVRSRGVTHLVSSSGGNAGLAAAYSARRLGARCTVVVPETTPVMMRQVISAEGANVEVHGSVWSEANAYAEMLVEQEDNACLVHPYDHADVWEGHSTIIDEVAAQLSGGPPDVVVVAVGGGGLLNGICEGLCRHGWYETAVVAMETSGADCLNQAYREGHIVKLPRVTSVAKSLGATSVSKRTWDIMQEGRLSLLPTVVSDAEAVVAVEKFADEMGMLVEPACGAALASIYSGVLSRLLAEGKLGQLRSVLVVVCGGRAVSPDLLQQWKEQVKSVSVIPTPTSTPVSTYPVVGAASMSDGSNSEGSPCSASVISYSLSNF